jgi:hypothetical protein
MQPLHDQTLLQPSTVSNADDLLLLDKNRFDLKGVRPQKLTRCGLAPAGDYELD